MSHREKDNLQSLGSDAFEAVWTADGHLVEETIYAWLDGALRAADVPRVVSHLETCAHCKPMVAEARGILAASSRIVGALDAVPRGIVPREDVAQVASRIVAMSKQHVQGTVSATIPATAHAAPVPVHRAWYLRRVVQMAAGLVVLVGGTTWIVKRDDGPPPAVAQLSKGEAKDKVAAVTTVAAPVKELDVSKTRASKAEQSLREDKASSKPLSPPPGVVTAAPPVSMPVATVGDSVRVPVGLTGIVTDAATGRPVEGVQVMVLGTTVGSLTNAEGRFSLQPVPGGVRQVQARRLGYQSVITSLDSSARESAPLSLQLRATNQALATVLIEAPVTPLIQRQSPFSTLAQPRIMQCLLLRADNDPDRAAPLRIQIGSISDADSSQFAVFGWPVNGQVSTGLFVMNPDGSIRATVLNNEARAVFALVPARNSWSGTMEEQRNGVTQVRQVVFDRDSATTNCVQR